MNIRITYILLILILNSHAQKLRTFGSVATDIKFNYSDFATVNVGVGLEYRPIRNFNPEIEFSYYFAGIADKVIENEMAETKKITSNMNAFNITFSPKIGFEESEPSFQRGFVQLFPILNLTKITTNSRLQEQIKGFSGFKEINRESVTQLKHSFGIGIGVYVDFYEKSQSLAINLKYQNIDFGSSLKSIKLLEDEKIDFYKTVSLEIKYYFAFYKKKKNN
jgi:hypothetical protein